MPGDEFGGDEGAEELAEGGAEQPLQGAARRHAGATGWASEEYSGSDAGAGASHVATPLVQRGGNLAAIFRFWQNRPGQAAAKSLRRPTRRPQHSLDAAPALGAAALGRRRDDASVLPADPATADDFASQGAFAVEAAGGKRPAALPPPTAAPELISSDALHEVPGICMRHGDAGTSNGAVSVPLASPMPLHAPPAAAAAANGGSHPVFPADAWAATSASANPFSLRSPHVARMHSAMRDLDRRRKRASLDAGDGVGGAAADIFHYLAPGAAAEPAASKALAAAAGGAQFFPTLAPTSYAARYGGALQLEAPRGAVGVRPDAGADPGTPRWLEMSLDRALELSLEKAEARVRAAYVGDRCESPLWRAPPAPPGPGGYEDDPEPEDAHYIDTYSRLSVNNSRKRLWKVGAFEALGGAEEGEAAQEKRRAFERRRQRFATLNEDAFGAFAEDAGGAELQNSRQGNLDIGAPLSAAQFGNLPLSPPTDGRPAVCPDARPSTEVLLLRFRAALTPAEPPFLVWVGWFAPDDDPQRTPGVLRLLQRRRARAHNLELQERNRRCRYSSSSNAAKTRSGTRLLRRMLKGRGAGRSIDTQPAHPAAESSRVFVLREFRLLFEAATAVVTLVRSGLSVEIPLRAVHLDGVLVRMGDEIKITEAAIDFAPGSWNPIVERSENKPLNHGAPRAEKPAESIKKVLALAAVKMTVLQTGETLVVTPKTGSTLAESDHESAAALLKRTFLSTLTNVF